MRLPWLVPPQPFLGLLLRRATVLWIFSRVFIAFYAVVVLGGGLSVLPETACLGLTTSVALTVLLAGLTVLDVYRRHEVILLANLGGSRLGVFFLVALPLLGLEALTCLLPL